MKLLIFAAVFATLVELNSSHATLPGKALYQALPQHERADFLIFALGHGYTRNSTKLQRNTGGDFQFPDALGISEALLQKFRRLAYPENFTSNLYALIRARYNLNEMSMRTLILERTVCFANGNCIDINDVGGLCCPF